MSAKTIKDLRNDLLKKYNETDFKDEKNINQLSTATACVSAIVRTAKVELEYKKHQNDLTEIEFLKTN